MKICITGANGYIGNHLVNFIDKEPEDHTILGISRYPINCNISSKITPAATDIEAWVDLFNGYDTVVHTSGVITDSPNHPEDSIYNINILQAEAVAKAASIAGIKRLIYISSIAIYGNMSVTPIMQSSHPNPQTEYAKSKLTAENRIQEIASNSKIELVIIRPPMVYGPNAKGTFRTIQKYIEMGLPIPFRKTKNLRSFIYIGNLISFIYSCVTNKDIKNEEFNISDGDDISTTELFKLIYDLKSKTAIEIPVPHILIKLILKTLKRERLYEQVLSSMQIDNSYACNKLNWKPEFSVCKGIKESIKS